MDLSYVLSRAIVLTPMRTARIAVTASQSPDLLELDAGGIVLLLAFSSPASLDEGFARVGAEMDSDRETYDALVGRLIECKFIVPVAAGDASGDGALAAESGLAGIRSHHHMLRDTYRVLAYKNTIQRLVGGKVVADIGCGTGILSVLAAKAGARRVYAIEETGIADVAQEMFTANGCDDRVTLLRGNSRDIELPERVDIILHEILGMDAIGENLLPVIADARRRMLVPGGLLVPHRVRIACVGVAAPTRWHRSRAIAAREIRDLQAAYGVSFEPVCRALERSEEFPCPIELSGADFEHRVLTDESLIYDLDLRTDPDCQPVRGELAIVEDGQLGGLVVFFRAELDEATEISNAPYLPGTHWKQVTRGFVEPVTVKAGQMVPFEARVVPGPIGQSIVVRLLAPELLDGCQQPS